MKDIRDYIHLYLGCEVQYRRKGTENWSTGKLVSISTFGSYVIESKDEQFAIELDQWDLRICCRKLSSMTEEEKEELLNACSNYFKDGPAKKWQFEAWSTKYLLQKGFDLFDLIPSGLAIDKETLK